jgi:cell division protein FtsB
MSSAVTKKSFIRRFYRSRLFLIVSLIVLGLVAMGYGRAYYQNYKIKQEIVDLQNEVKSLEKKKLASFKILEYVTSPEFVEAKARTELNLKKPGENVLVMPRVNQTEEAGDNGVSEAKKINNPLRWWYYFSHQSVDTDEGER